jgi:hypothetical protein
MRNRAENCEDVWCVCSVRKHVSVNQSQGTRWRRITVKIMQIDLMFKTSLNAPSLDVGLGCGCPQTPNEVAVQNWFQGHRIILDSERSSIDPESQSKNQRNDQVASMNIHDD